MMSDFETVARPYARAIFELANEQDSLQHWDDSLKAAALIASDEQMLAVFDSPTMLSADQAQLFLSVYAGIETAPAASSELANLIAVLAENGRLASIPAIALMFETYKQQAEGKVEVLVTSAMALDENQQQKIAQGLAKKLGKEVSITTAVDDSLIAGAVIQAGDMVIDGSARGRLDNLAMALDN